jgi:outer membrane protein TolC
MKKEEHYIQKIKNKTMYKMKKLFFIVIVFLIQLSAKSQEKREITIESAKTYALNHSKNKMNDVFEIEKAELKVKEYLGLLLPQVNGDLSFTHFGKLPSSIIPSNTFPGQTEDLVTTFGTPNNVSANINLSQIIFNGSFLIGVKGAQEYVELSKKELALNDEQIIDQVIRAFYAVLVTRENLEIIKQNKTNLEKLIFETEQYYKNGFVEQLDVDRLKLSLTNLNTTIKGIELQVKLTETLLKYQMGMPLDEPIIVIGKLDDFLTNITIGIDSIADFSNRGDVNLMNARVNLQKTNIKRLKYEYLPSLVGFATIGSQALRQKFDFFNFNEPWLNQRFFGVQLNVPIWDSYSRKRTIQGVEVGIKQIEMTRDIMIDGYEIQFENAKTELITAFDAYTSYQSNIQLAEKIYKTTQVKYKEGIGSSLELKSAESELYTTQSNYINAIYRVLIAKQEINKLLGIL